jgi:hypothetical protein
MKTTVYLNEFRDYFNKIRPTNFSYEGLGIIWDYLAEYENSTGEDVELDVIGICCDFCEADIDDIIKNYSIDIEADKDKFEQVFDYLEYHSNVIGSLDDNKTIIYQNF